MALIPDARPWLSFLMNVTVITFFADERHNDH